MARSADGTKRAAIDWEAVEMQYRAGIRSLKDIGTEFGVSDAGIIKRAKRDGWSRDLKAKIQAKADAKVSAAMVSAEVSEQTKLTEALVIETEAAVQARIRLSHRTDIARYRSLALNLLGELEHHTDNGDLYGQLFELLSDPEAESEDANAAARERQRKRREAFEKAMSLAGRTKTMKDLADTLKTLIGLEREAFGVEAAEAPPADGAQLMSENETARRIAFVLHRVVRPANQPSFKPRQAAS